MRERGLPVDRYCGGNEVFCGGFFPVYVRVVDCTQSLQWCSSAHVTDFGRSTTTIAIAGKAIILSPDSFVMLLYFCLFHNRKLKPLLTCRISCRSAIGPNIRGYRYSPEASMYDFQPFLCT